MRGQNCWETVHKRKFPNTRTAVDDTVQTQGSGVTGGLMKGRRAELPWVSGGTSDCTGTGTLMMVHGV